MPFFDLSTQRNVTAAVGQSAFLHCTVEQLGDKAVKINLFHHILFIYFLFLLLLSIKFIILNKKLGNIINNAKRNNFNWE